MLKMKFVILDDELYCCKTLELFLKSINKDFEIIAIFESPLQALEQIPYLQFDILFCDIEMPHLNGFQFLKKLTHIHFTVVFVTAYNQYAIEAFKYSAFDYILKPIDPIDLNFCINRWKENKKKLDTEFTQVEYLNEILYKNTTPNKIILNSKSSIDFVLLEDIIYCKAESNYTNFYCLNNKKYCVSKTMGEYETLLLNNGFERIHKSFIIQPKYITKIIRPNGYFIEMLDKDIIPVSRSKYAFIKSLSNIEN